MQQSFESNQLAGNRVATSALSTGRVVLAA
jgi:hypothetical protein